MDEKVQALVEKLIQAGDDLRYDEYGVLEFPIGHLARKWDDSKAELEAALRDSAAPRLCSCCEHKPHKAGLCGRGCYCIANEEVRAAAAPVPSEGVRGALVKAANDLVLKASVRYTHDHGEPDPSPGVAFEVAIPVNDWQKFTDALMRARFAALPAANEGHCFTAWCDLGQSHEGHCAAEREEPASSGGVASLMEASKNLLEACYQVDAREELDEEIDGSLLDAVRDGLIAAHTELAAREEPAVAAQLREALEDLLNNYACSCMAIAAPCPRCKVSVDEARALLSASPCEDATEGNKR